MNCSKIQLSLFGSLRDDSKSEKTVMWHLLIMVEKQERKNRPNRILKAGGEETCFNFAIFSLQPQ